MRQAAVRCLSLKTQKLRIRTGKFEGDFYGVVMLNAGGVLTFGIVIHSFTSETAGVVVKDTEIIDS